MAEGHVRTEHGEELFPAPAPGYHDTTAYTSGVKPASYSSPQAESGDSAQRGWYELLASGA